MTDILRTISTLCDAAFDDEEHLPDRTTLVFDALDADCRQSAELLIGNC